MAEALNRSQIIKEQIDNLKSAAPPALTQAERDRIMSGRKGQKDIDAGRAAIDARAKEISDHTKALNELYTKLETAGKDEGAAATAASSETRRLEREAGSNPLLTTAAPFGAGAAVGAGVGEIENRILHKFGEGNAKAIVEIGNEIGPTNKLTNSKVNLSRATGAAQAAEKYAPSSPLRQGAAVAGRGLSYAVPAGLFYNEYQKYQHRADDPNSTDADKQMNQGISNALLGTSTGIAGDGGMRFFFPSRHDGEGEAMMRINAARDFARRTDEKAAAPAATRAERTNLPGSRPDMMGQAQRLNIPGRSKMNVEELRAAVGEAIKNTPAPRGGAAVKMLKGMAGPVVGAAVAADAAYNQARAAGEDVGGAAADAAKPAAVVGGGLVAGRKLAEALPPVVGKAMAPLGDVAAPSMVDAMTDYTQEDLNQGRNIAARNLPSFMRAGGIEDAYQMAQVPDRNPERGAAPAQDFDAQLAELQNLLSQVPQPEQPSPVQSAAASPPQWQSPQMPQNRLLGPR